MHVSTINFSIKTNPNGNRLFNLAFLLLLITQLCYATPLRIRLLSTKTVSSVILSGCTNNYYVAADNDTILMLSPSSMLEIDTASGDSILIKDLVTHKIKKASTIAIIPIREASGFKLTANGNEIRMRNYDDKLEITTTNHQLKIINTVDIEKYISGVVLAEVGSNQPYEFYKLKSIICRTYALSAIRKHELENYHLCDQVHCQVFYGTTSNPFILNAVNETAGLVLVDNNVELITAGFHANCGGETVNSEDAWSKKLPYLRSINDNFCTNQPSSKWKKTITRNEWLNYFAQKYHYPITDSEAVKELINFKQSERKSKISYKKIAIPLKSIREDWGLRSTFFSCQADSTCCVSLSGRGYGHGVGLCQDGAIQMSKKGYTAKQIIDFYYNNVSLINLSQLNFFKE